MKIQLFNHVNNRSNRLYIEFRIDILECICWAVVMGVIFHAEIKKGNPRTIDRKSTRLNSSHVAISYAVFCLKKKKKHKRITKTTDKNTRQPNATPAAA